MDLRPLGSTGLKVSSVALGCWPIAGVSSLGVTRRQSLDTIAACLDCGVNFLDTAYMYGASGESERLISEALGCGTPGSLRDRVVIATKCGLHFDAAGQRAHDARPERLRRECEESLERLRTDRVDLLYLHAPDPNVPIAESAGGLRELLEAGKARSIGVSNLSMPQLEQFALVCPPAAVQPHYNLLQREIEADLLPWCRERGVSVCVYWPLLKGLLAGKLPRDFVFQPGDGRAKYAMFQGEAWRKNQDFVDRLREIAAEIDKSVAQVAINWVIHRPGVTSALCGAKRPDQLRDNAGAMGWRLTAEQLRRIEQAWQARGETVEMRAL